MAKKGFFKSTFGFLFDVKRWISADEIKRYGRLIKNSAKDLAQTKPAATTTITEASEAKDFAGAAQAFQLSEEEIARRTKYFFYYFLIYFCVSLGLLVYAIYLIQSSGRLLAVLATLFLGIAMFVYALREHFLYMEMKQRKLGCSFTDWLAFIFHVKSKRTTP